MAGDKDVSALIEASPSKRVLADRIERLNISADAKALLLDLAGIVVEIGGRMVHVGRKILTFILDLVKAFPNTAFGIIVALVVTMLIASIPLLGALLSPLLGPLLLAFGVARGALADLKDGAIARKVRDLETELSALKATH